MKKKWIIIIAVLALIAVLAAACSDIGSSENKLSDDNGATVSSVSEEEITAASEEVENTLSAVATADYLESEIVTVNEEQQVVTAEEEGATLINLSELTAENAPSGTAFDGSLLTIKKGGTYVLSGTLNGAVTVKKDIEETVRIVLSGATIKTLDSQACAAIVFAKTDALRILTIADGTVNEVSDSVGDTEADGDGAAIQAKKCSLTINGSGTLKVTAVGEDASGIKVKKELTVLSATLEVTAVKNGIKAGTLLEIKEATVTVTAGNDGIKTDVEPESEEEATAYAADPTAGYIYIENSTLTVTAGDDGIAADSCLYINNRDEDVITVTTNGGAPATVTEGSSDAADGKALKVGGIVLTDEEDNETLYPATYDENYAIVITGGTFRLNSNDDALHSKGNLLIAGGTFTIASGDDGIHAEYLTKITGGTITITKGYEGIEGAAVEITGGEIVLTAADDGVNAANADLNNYSYYILITGGSLTVNCSGDGVDSNGKLLISGGTVMVFGPTNGGNSALDSETGSTISGGTLVATCYEAMDPVGSTQYMISANVNVTAGSTVTLKDSSGATIVTFTAPKTCRNIVISTPDLKAGTYTLAYGSASTSVTASVGTTNRSFGGQGGFDGQGGMGGPGGRPGGTRTAPALSEGEESGEEPPALPEGEMPEFNGEFPSFPNGEHPQQGPEPPALPSGETPEFGQEPPALPEGEQPSFGEDPFGFGGQGGRGRMPGGRQGGAFPDMPNANDSAESPSALGSIAPSAV